MQNYEVGKHVFFHWGSSSVFSFLTSFELAVLRAPESLIYKESANTVWGLCATSRDVCILIECIWINESLEWNLWQARGLQDFVILEWLATKAWAGTASGGHLWSPWLWRQFWMRQTWQRGSCHTLRWWSFSLSEGLQMCFPRMQC